MGSTDLLPAIAVEEENIDYDIRKNVPVKYDANSDIDSDANNSSDTDDDYNPLSDDEDFGEEMHILFSQDEVFVFIDFQ